MRTMATSYLEFSIAGPSHAFEVLCVDGGRVCYCCQSTGHWKDQCAVLRSRNKHKFV